MGSKSARSTPGICRGQYYLVGETPTIPFILFLANEHFVIFRVGRLKNPCPLFRAEILVSNSDGMTHAIGGRRPMKSPSWVVWEFHPLRNIDLRKCSAWSPTYEGVGTFGKCGSGVLPLLREERQNEQMLDATWKQRCLEVISSIRLRRT